MRVLLNKGGGMKPGRELDALIAEKVMGWKPQYEGGYLFPPADEPDRKKYLKWNGEAYVTEIPSYSTDIAAAWTIIDKIESSADFVCYEIRSGDKENHNTDQGTSVYFCIGRGSAWAHSMESAAHAICLAALKAIGFKFETA